MIWIWLAIIIFCIFIDICSSSFLFVVFSIGALGALICNILELSILIQFTVFGIITSLFFIFIFPRVRRNIKESKISLKTMEQNYIGRTFVLPEKIKDTALIKYEGVFWTFKSKGGVIEKGEKVKIIGIEGNKLLIIKVK